MESMRRIATYLRQMPQVALLLAITLILGIGTFVAVLIALASASPGTPSGEPSGALESVRVLAQVLVH
jgi:ABC-type phosphate/phosphonate transport system permease subunit